MDHGGSRTNRNISICILEGSEITAREVTDLPCVSASGPEQDSVQFIEVGTALTVRALPLGGGGGISVDAKLEVSNAVVVEEGDVPSVMKGSIEFSSMHKDAEFVKVWSTDFPASQAGRPLAIYVRAFEATGDQDSEMQTEKKATTQ